MVRRNSAMGANLRQSIKRSFGRYIAIVAIIALGSALFMGLMMTKTDMVHTGQVYMDRQDMFDLRIMNSYGWTDAYVAEIAALDGIEAAEGVSYLDLIARLGDEGEDGVHRFYAIPQTLDRVALRGGRMPESPDECLADGFQYDRDILGASVTISPDNDEDSLDAVKEKSFTVVGLVASPLYMDMNRGTTTVGSGSLGGFVYVLPQALDLDYYPEIHVTVPGDWEIYTDTYHDAMADLGGTLEETLAPLAQRRLEEVVAEAEAEYADGLADYREGFREFQDGRREALAELRDGLRQLEEGEQALKDNEQRLSDGQDQLEQARRGLLAGEKTLEDSKKTLATSKAAAYKNLSDSTTDLMSQFQSLSGDMEDLRAQELDISTRLTAVEGEILPLEVEKTTCQAQISQTNAMIGILDTSIAAAERALELAQSGGDPETIQSLEQELADLRDQRQEQADLLEEQEEALAAVEAELAPLYDQREDLQWEQECLQGEMDGLQTSLDSISQGLLELVVTQTVMDNEFAAADAQIESAQAQLESGKLELELQQKTIEDGLAALEEGKKTLRDSRKEYNDGKAQAEKEIAEAQAELRDGALDLAQARRTIDDMTENDILVLDRTSNVGYNNLESSSDIVQGVSRVIPVFFILVASLVCITTMTRMIEEERTQIGTLKALGYGNGAIISKYLLYSGSGALLGCGLGVAVGSVIFPMILWQAYCIMLYIQPVVLLTVNWPLCLGVVSLYTGTMLLVTWYCCRRALREEPAELIRPKSPDPGKKLLVERLPLWRHVSFLNKVTVRNIFRYRQRLAMMLVGIGGCTALLVTGFGLQDSIMNVVDYQFQEVALYDMEVYFKDGLDDEAQATFREAVEEDTQSLLFFHQSSVDIDFDGSTKEIYLIAAPEALTGFIDLHTDDRPLPMPGAGEVVLSAGVAENLDIAPGDRVTIRNADLQSMELTVSGVYDNHVYNYAIITPETMADAWGREPEVQMAFLITAPDRDVHTLGARVTGLDGVLNVAISQDLADLVGGMMDAMDLVVWVIVFCAGLLAVIVLYNLTNININERIREIATIKVLGFNAGETAAYVFKENLTLTVAGSLFGLLLGRLMLLFVMSQIRIDMVWFKALVEPRSYLWSLGLTLLSAVAVDFIFYFRLDKINMAEALKSVE